MVDANWKTHCFLLLRKKLWNRGLRLERLTQRGLRQHFEEDDDTHAIPVIGELGGPQEAEAAHYIREHITKPVVAYLAGMTAPKGRTMRHAGAIISAFGESASEKVEILTAAGVTVAANPTVMGETIASVM